MARFANIFLVWWMCCVQGVWWRVVSSNYGVFHDEPGNANTDEVGAPALKSHAELDKPGNVTVAIP
jgi:hypothetical protein